MVLKKIVSAATGTIRDGLDVVFSTLDLNPATELEVQGTFLFACFGAVGGAFYYYRQMKNSQKQVLQDKQYYHCGKFV